MKLCRKCNIQKEIKEFNFKNKAKGILNSQCKICTRLQLKLHYKNNRVYYLEKAKKRNKTVWLIVRTAIWKYLIEHPCVDCGEKDPIVLEFDHLKDKKMNVSSLTSDASLKKVFEEVAKCEVRCANCHRRKTAIQQGWYKYII